MRTVHVRGAVLPSETGSVLKARVTRVHTARPAAVAVLAMGLIGVAQGEAFGWLFVVLAAPIGAAAWSQVGMIPDWMAPRARYLVTRLYAGLDRIDHRAAGSTPRPANEAVEKAGVDLGAK